MSTRPDDAAQRDAPVLTRRAVLFTRTCMLEGVCPICFLLPLLHPYTSHIVASLPPLPSTVGIGWRGGNRSRTPCHSSSTGYCYHGSKRGTAREEQGISAVPDAIATARLDSASAAANAAAASIMDGRLYWVASSLKPCADTYFVEEEMGPVRPLCVYVLSCLVASCVLDFIVL